MRLKSVNKYIVVAISAICLSPFLYMPLLEKSATASVINDDLLKIQAALYPKIILMDSDYEQKLVNNSINIVIIYTEENYSYARRLRDIMEEKYKAGIKDYPLKIEILSYDQVMKEKVEATAFYLFPADFLRIQEIVNYPDSGRLLFVYDRKDLQYGCHIGVKIGRKVRPVINLDAVKARNITLRPVLLKISEFY